jgi:DNA-binding transcriptional MocR family regulator
MAVRHKPYNAHKRGAGRHVQLSEYLQATEALASLKPGPRALYIELKRRFNDTNNGHFFLSQRDAAKALNVTKDTVTGYFKGLSERSFITTTQGGGGTLAPLASGRQQSTRCKRNPCTANPPLKVSSLGVAKQKPVQKNETSRPKNSDAQASNASKAAELS